MVALHVGEHGRRRQAVSGAAGELAVGDRDAWGYGMESRIYAAELWWKFARPLLLLPVIINGY